METFGLAAMEAAAMGLPLILSSGGALTEIFNGSAIFIPEPFSVDILAQSFVDSVEGRISFPYHSLQYLDEQYSLDARLRALSNYLPPPL